MNNNALFRIHARLILLTRAGPIELATWREGPALWDLFAPIEDLTLDALLPNAGGG